MTLIKQVGKKKTTWGVSVKANGKDRWMGTFPTKGEARAAEVKALVRFQGNKGGITEETCDQFAKRWLVDFPFGQNGQLRRNSTIRQHQANVDVFAQDFSGVKLRDVTKSQAQIWANHHGNKVNSVKAMFATAVKVDLLDQNSFSVVSIPGSRGRRDIDVLTEEQLHNLANAAVAAHRIYGEELRAMIYFAAYTGMRWGEIVVLEWEDIDFRSNEINVDKTLSDDREVLLPKNSKPRVIAMAPVVAEVLQRMPRHLNRELVFTTITGKRFRKSTWFYAWNPIRAVAGIPAFNFHELRHFHATWLYNLGVPMDLAVKQMGHSDAGELLRKVYQHPLEQDQLDETKGYFQKAQPPTKLDEFRARKYGE